MNALDLTLLYLAAAVLGVVGCRLLKLPPMLGYLVVGVVIGPNALALAQNSQGLRYLAEFGVVFLMFVIGLEFSLPKLKAMKRHVFGLGLSQVVLTVTLTTLGSLALGRLLPAWWKMEWQTALALGGVAMVIWGVPPEPAEHKNQPRGKLSEVLTHPGLLRLDFGVFVLHAVQLAMWVAVPALLVQGGLSKDHHWWVYLPAVLASFFVMGGTLFPLERRGYLRAVFLSAIGLVALVQLGLLVVASGAPTVTSLGLLMFVFFCGFNILEASQPSMASRIAPPHARGAALGVYNTLQSLGFFAGGLAGGVLVKGYGVQGLFAVCTAAMALWLLVAWPMRAPAKAGLPARSKAA